MKRALSLLLSVMLLAGCFSFGAVLAAPDSANTFVPDITYLTDDEALVSHSDAEASSEAQIADIENAVDTVSFDTAAAVLPSGYFGANEGKRYIEFVQDFEAQTPISPVYTTTAKDTLNFGYERPGGHTYTYSTEKGLFANTGDNSKHLTLATVYKAAKFLGCYYGVGEIAAQEKVHFYADIMARDFCSTKSAYLTWRNAVNPWESLFAMGEDGFITFGETGVTYPYSLNRWYRFDAVIKFNQGVGDNSGTHNIYFYLNGKLMASLENRRNYQTQNGLDYYAPAGMRFDVGASTGTGESVFCIDNIGGKIYSATENGPDLTQTKYAYTNFDIHEFGQSSDYFNAEGSAFKVDYLISNGVYGKETNDKSMKISTNLAVSGAAYDPSADWAVNNTSTESYVLNMNSIRPDGNLPVGSQLKISLSYAYKGCDPAGEGGEYFQFVGNESGEKLFEISREGVLTAVGGNTTFTLEKEMWYNIEVITTVNSDTTLDYTIYINGIPEITGNFDCASLQGADCAVIYDFIICSYLTKGHESETYLDDMYFEYFTGNSSDVAEPNAAVENSNVDLSVNGKLIVPAGYNVANLIEDTAGTIKVLRNGASVQSGTVENALLVAGELLPVYGYAQIKLKLHDPMFVLSDGSLEVTADVESNQAEPIDITLIAAVYAEGKIHSVRSKSLPCNIGTTQLKIEDIAFPEGGEVTVFTIEGWSSKKPIFDDQIYTVTQADLVHD